MTGPKAVVEALRLEDGALRGPDRLSFHFGPHSHRDLKIQIVSPSTHDFHLAGAQRLKLVNFGQDSLTLTSAGAVDIEGQGQAKRLDATLSGASHLALGQLPVEAAVVSIAGAGDAEIDPRASADISISGAGHVGLRTRPPVLHTHVSGMGSVTQP